MPKFCPANPEIPCSCTLIQAIEFTVMFDNRRVLSSSWRLTAIGTIGILAAALLLGGISLASMHRAYADILIFINGSTCEPDLGGTWDGGSNTCTLPSMTLAGDTDLEVASGVTAVVPSSSIVEIGSGRSFQVSNGSVLNIENGSIIVLNGGTLTNSGMVTVNNSGGSADDGIENSGTIDNTSSDYLCRCRRCYLHSACLS